MSYYTNELSKTSYTNKDFNAVYPELLDLAKSLSYKWDPTISDESDPGVVLIKLAALMTDKLNYNLDKNILETSPATVSQVGNARSLFDLCGYTMQYYKSAKTTITLKLAKEPAYSSIKPSYNTESTDSLEDVIASLQSTANLGNSTIELQYRIPRFTMISDPNNTMVFTITDPVNLSSSLQSSVVSAIQGTCVTYDINGETTINVNHLDPDRRIYFTELNVAQNGVFVRDEDSDDLSRGGDWKLVDNLEIQSVDERCCKFGVTKDGTRCYLEFPSNISNIIGNGIKINYVLSAGQSGNMGRRQLTKIYADSVNNVEVLAPYADLGGKYATTLTNDNLIISNLVPATHGADPESIATAYKNYEKTKGTFDTLVSLKDYNNFVKTSEHASNGFVCDRTNDIQRSHKVITRDMSGRQYTTYTIDSAAVRLTDISGDAHEVLMDAMQPYDLCIYALQHVDKIESALSFNATFEPLARKQTQNSLLDLEGAIENTKSIQHNFIDYVRSKPLFIFNKYAVKASIVPNSKLETTHISEVKENVKQALYKTLNSCNISFGEEIKYDVLYDTIANADSRIKTVLLDALVYNTYVCYIDSNGAYGIFDLNGDSLTSEEETIKEEILLNCVLCGVTPVYEIVDDFSYSANYSALSFGDTVLNEEGSATPVLPTDTQNKQPYKDNGEDVPVVQGSYSPYCSEVHRVTTSLVLNSTQDDNDVSRIQKLTIGENENIVFLAPNYIKDRSFSGYCKYITNIKNGNLNYVSNSTNYTLGTDEFIVFFWKPNSEDEQYTYRRYNEGAILCPSFKVNKNNEFTKNNESIDLTVLVENNCATDSGTIVDSMFNETLADLISNDYVLSGTRTIEMKKMNQVDINNPNNGTNAIFWILNSSTVKDGQTISYLFNKDCIVTPSNETQSSYLEYHLKSGEYLIYADTHISNLYLLGAGTRIRCTVNSDSLSLDNIIDTWKCPTVSYDKLLSQGFMNYLEDKWFYCDRVDRRYTLEATEMQYIQLGEGTTVELTPKEAVADPSISVTSNVPTSLHKFSTIKYIHKEETVELATISNTQNGWTCYALLNLVSGPNSPQTLNYDNKHEITLHHYREVIVNGKKQNITFDKTLKSFIDPVSSQQVNTKFTSHKPLNVSGGSNVIISQLTSSGDMTNIDFYSFKDAEYVNVAADVSSELSNAVTSNDFDKTVRPVPDPSQEKYEYQAEVNFTLPNSHYIIPVSVRTPCDSFDIFDSSNNKMIPLSGEEQIAGEKMYYFEVTPDQSANISLRIKGTPKIQWGITEATKVATVDSQGNVQIKQEGSCTITAVMGKDFVSCDIVYAEGVVTLTLHQPASSEDHTTYLKMTCDASLTPVENEPNTYTTSDTSFKLTPIPDDKSVIINAPLVVVVHSPIKVSYKANTPRIKTLLAESGVNNKIYDYANTGDENQILNPWEPASFVKYNHPYNPFTICQWDLTNVKDDIVVLNNVRG